MSDNQNNNNKNNEYWRDEDQGFGLLEITSNHGKISNSEIKIQNKNSNNKIKSIVGKMFNDKKEKEKALSNTEQIDKMVQMYKELEKQNKELRSKLEENQNTEKQKQREMVMNQNRHSEKPIMSGMRNLSSEDENEINKVSSWKTTDKLNNSSALNRKRSRTPEFYKTPNVKTHNWIQQNRQSRSRSCSRSPSPTFSERELASKELKAIREASKSALFTFKGRTDEDLQTWIYSMETYLSYLRLTPKDEVKIAIAYLREQALQKFICHPNKNSMTWNELKNILIQTYKSVDYQTTLRRKLTTIKQSTTLENYLQKFDKTISHMYSRSEDFFLSLFLNGLKPHLGRQVSMNRPSTYEQAKQVAISVEANYKDHKMCCFCKKKYILVVGNSGIAN
jgi:hypothetical protein